MKPMKIHEALRWASLFLADNNREERVAEILLLHHLGLTKPQMLMALRDPIAEDAQERFIQDVEAHASTGIPVQHLTGVEMFYGRTFAVDNHVLIPRPETEELIVGVLAYIDRFPEPVSVVDLGTGSGIIAVTLKLEKPSLDVSASDLSEEALQVARRNADALEADINFYQGDFLTPLIETEKTVDIIVSNPPYIPFSDENSLSDTVKNHDPRLALFAEDNGLAAYQQIIHNAHHVLNKPGLLAFEIGYQQGESVSSLIKQAFPSSEVEVRKDINGKDRMVFGFIQ
ncbi:peptide chain release factor N(5)-glutamine methyltransferase [Aquibacillus koreensis]|uniref:Release factor glutamine methyltransferase n=1 Tax=Aquibacillus koreensis TaxID=279446 RepID=A0A9X3WIS4_9BACI|nr:peptide chain release factor N(5)-glutamine methyltransferase [Aquibacillus koreensis]MCT2538295.1 peptide chain release factor N(5)-glutamine methyltransferase [Aquibacillus koreensis]MDC3420762.1 peptide chain release factor N(5)-glutamine methyltransferase [Aquibacillus koreensis]